jgi:hypothetical protein
MPRACPALGSVLFKNYYPDRDSFVAERLKDAGALLLAKDYSRKTGWRRYLALPFRCYS